ncbi:hypothetical protein J6P92_08185 [bacterium]|nr:hypothetical protein [bacterium]
MKENFKKTILIDLDGVLNIYTGNFDKDFIPPIKEGAYEFIKELSNDYTVKIFTTRNRMLASKWVIENNLQEYIDDITNVKDISYLIIDDRCINFNGDFKNLKKQIDNFKPWYKLEE